MKPTIPDVLPLAQIVYDRHCAGCCSHIVLDDDNVDDSHVLFCIEQAEEYEHADCLALCKALLQMSKTQRLKLGNLVNRLARLESK